MEKRIKEIIKGLDLSLYLLEHTNPDEFINFLGKPENKGWEKELRGFCHDAIKVANACLESLDNKIK